MNKHYSNLVKAIIPIRKQMDFVNRAIKHELEREQEKLERQQIVGNLGTLSKQIQSMPKLKVKSEEMVRELREGSTTDAYLNKSA